MHLVCHGSSVSLVVLSHGLWQVDVFRPCWNPCELTYFCLDSDTRFRDLVYIRWCMLEKSPS